eukprot:TRINITY_DN18531_c0_g1_i2.p1 TRINITY_DN18531_c0_g1~~TRINITY_DN18531_c0_g1_i2.p1  ORF type:complete len:110 (-),score=1.20 TRINITY_DN18531_c0_g1_i2:419-748(-)
MASPACSMCTHVEAVNIPSARSDLLEIKEKSKYKYLIFLLGHSCLQFQVRWSLFDIKIAFWLSSVPELLGIPGHWVTRTPSADNKEDDRICSNPDTAIGGGGCFSLLHE